MRWTVKFPRRVVNEETDAECFGLTDFERQTIAVDSTLPNDLFRDTLFHEVGHAVTTGTGLDQSMTTSQEERFVSSFMPALLQVLRDNRWLTDLLLERD